MKNFRKVLALVLVVATLFSFVAMAGAKEYTDAEKISYDEAVDVLSAIGILNGYTDGSFKPTNSITRAEMAKMIAVLSNAGADVSELYASACDFADAKEHWAASYIAYCAQTGIVAGYSATAFGPQDNVTGLQTAKMLLCLIGLDAEKQGYVGANWKVNVLRDAKEFGLLDGFAAGYNVDANITREEAANMMMNALMAPMVIGYLSENIVTLTNKVVIDGETFDVGDFLKLTDATAKGWSVLYGNVVVAPIWVCTNYDGLTVAPYTDCFGRPATVWQYKDARDNVVLEKVYTEAPEAVYTTGEELTATYKTLKDWDITVYEDGDDVASTLAAAEAMTGNGVRTEVYVNETYKTVTIVVINPYWGEVTEVKEYADKYTVKFADGFSEEFAQPAEKFAVGDVVMAHFCEGGLNHDNARGTETLHDIAVVKPEAHKIQNTIHYVDGTEHDACSFLADGKTYNYNKYAEELFTDDVTLNLYFDEYGYLFLVKDIDETVEYKYAYVEEGTIEFSYNKSTIGADGTTSHDWTYTADFYGYEKAGAVSAVETVVATDNDGSNNPVYAADYAGYDIIDLVQERSKYWNVGALVKYTVSNDKAVFAGESAYAPAGTVIGPKNIVVDQNLWANAETKFMIRSTNPATGALSYEVVVGYKNLTETYIAKASNKPGAESSIQYFAADNGMLEYVFIDAYYSSVATTFMPLSVKFYANADVLPGYDGMQGYIGLVDGEKAMILVAKEQAEELVNGKLYTSAWMVRGADTSYFGEKLPLYVVMTESELVFEVPVGIELDKATGTDGKTYIQAKITVDGKTNFFECASDLKVFYYAPKDEDGTYAAVESKLYNDLIGKYNCGYYVLNAEGEIAALYLTNEAIEGGK